MGLGPRLTFAMNSSVRRRGVAFLVDGEGVLNGMNSDAIKLEMRSYDVLQPQ